MPRALRRGRLASAIATLALSAAVVTGSLPPAQATTGAITLFGASLSNLRPTFGIVEGPNGNLFFVNNDSTTRAIGEMTPAGAITFHTDPGITAEMYDLTVGGDGNIWFTIGLPVNKIGRYNPTTDAFSYFAAGLNAPAKITTAPDGSVWYIGQPSKAQRMHTGGTGTAGTLGVSVNTGGSTGDIISGPDGNIWMTKANGTHALRRVDATTNAVTDFPFPGGDIDPNQLTVGPGDDLWFTYGFGVGAVGVGRFDLATSTYTTMPIPVSSTPKGITEGSDGRVWFVLTHSATSGDAVGRLDANGQGFTSFTAAQLRFGSGQDEITAGPNGDLYFTATGTDERLGRVTIDPPTCDGRAITVDLNDGDTPTNGDDVILGTPGPDTINALGGNDRICGGDRGDTVNGGEGNDRMFGFKGSDTLNGGNGNDRTVGGQGNDTCRGNGGTDTQQTCEIRTGFP